MRPATTHAARTGGPGRQSGTAAVEFALIVSFLLLMLFGTLIYWRAIQVQQSVARAAGDGARMIQHLAHAALPGFNPTRPAEQANILQATINVVNQSLAASGLASAPAQVQITWTSSQATLQVVYLLPPLLADGLQLGHLHLAEPTRLQAQSFVKLSAGS